VNSTLFPSKEGKMDPREDLIDEPAYASGIGRWRGTCLETRRLG